MDRVFIYWDLSNIYVAGKDLAEERENAPHAKNRFRIDFVKLMQLAEAGRTREKAVASGAVPAGQMRGFKVRLNEIGAQSRLFDLDQIGGTEQDIPDYYIQRAMLEDGFDHQGDPGTIVLFTGDGAGYLEGTGFHANLERLHKWGWRIELLSWVHSCNERMRGWVEENGLFVALDDFYESITFLTPSGASPGRNSAPLDLSRRPRG